MQNQEQNARKKIEDFVEIPGAYQHDALTKGHLIQRAWHRSRLDFLKGVLNLSKDDLVADFGCGSGIFVDLVRHEVDTVFGIDSSSRAITFCSEFFADVPNTKFLKGDLANSGLPKHSIDKILCLEVLEHVFESQVSEIFLHWQSILRKDGLVLITTPNEYSIWPFLELSVDKLGIFPKMADDQHVSHWNRGKMCRLLEAHGFSVLQSGTFNLVAPMAYLFGRKIGRFSLRLEKQLLKEMGPLSWVLAQIR